MKYFSWVFAPTKNRRLNELVGFLVFVSAVLLFLALASYSPLDPSLNTAATPGVSHPAKNWIGLFGALLSDLWLQYLGIAVFFVPVGMLWMAGRWFKSRETASPGAKAIGALTLMIFFPALLGLLPWHWHWMHAVPVEGLLGRIVSDVLLHYFNLAGAYIVCASVIAVALYLSTTFSFGRVQEWTETRLAFMFAGWQWLQDWRSKRAKKKAERELEKRRTEKPIGGTSHLVPARRTSPPQPMSAAMEEAVAEEAALGIDDAATSEPAIGARADSGIKSKTVALKIAGTYKLPSSSLLHQPDGQQAVNEEELKSLANVLTSKCAEFDVTGAITQINPGPVVTTYEFKPEAGVKYSRVTSLADDLCLAMRAESILIERMAGKSTVGIQVPNHQRETIWLREVVESPEFIGTKSKLTLAMGKDINGRIVTADLGGMPHLLIAGSTGTGKSVAINAMIMSILYKATPEQVRLVLVDPKRLELGNYEGVPHLHTPIITEPKLAANALRNAVREMERRLKLLAEKGVRNIDQYNKLFDEDPSLNLFGENSDERPLPHIVIIIDELADLMMLDSGNVEESVTRLAQMARAVGLHLVRATERPDVDVVTGLIR